MGETVTVSEVKQPFSDADLAALQGLQYKTRAIARLLSEKWDLSKEFNRYLLRLQAPAAMAFNQMMSAYGGNPSGVEFRCKDRQAWAFVLPDASEQGRQRIQYFDGSGFVSHHPYDSVVECVESMVREGYVVEDCGALDRLTDTDEWRRGVEVAGLIHKLNGGQITHAEFAELVSAL